MRFSRFASGAAVLLALLAAPRAASADSFSFNIGVSNTWSSLDLAYFDADWWVSGYAEPAYCPAPVVEYEPVYVEPTYWNWRTVTYHPRWYEWSWYCGTPVPYPATTRVIYSPGYSSVTYSSYAWSPPAPLYSVAHWRPTRYYRPSAYFSFSYSSHGYEHYKPHYYGGGNTYITNNYYDNDHYYDRDRYYHHDNRGNAYGHSRDPRWRWKKNNEAIRVTPSVASGAPDVPYGDRGTLPGRASVAAGLPGGYREVAPRYGNAADEPGVTRGSNRAAVSNRAGTPAGTRGGEGASRVAPSASMDTRGRVSESAGSRTAVRAGETSASRGAVSSTREAPSASRSTGTSTRSRGTADRASEAPSRTARVAPDRNPRAGTSTRSASPESASPRTVVPRAGTSTRDRSPQWPTRSGSPTRDTTSRSAERSQTRADEIRRQIEQRREALSSRGSTATRPDTRASDRTPTRGIQPRTANPRSSRDAWTNWSAQRPSTVTPRSYGTPGNSRPSVRSGDTRSRVRTPSQPSRPTIERYRGQITRPQSPPRASSPRSTSPRIQRAPQSSRPNTRATTPRNRASSPSRGTMAPSNDRRSVTRPRATQPRSSGQPSAARPDRSRASRPSAGRSSSQRSSGSRRAVRRSD